MVELRQALDRLSPAEHEPEVVHDFEMGERVKVVDGSLAGVIGVIREIRGGRRLLIGVEQIGQALSISIGSARVQRLSEP
jgi:transcription antitermination factor NusG